MIRRVIEKIPENLFVQIEEVETNKVYFFFESKDWFYITGDMQCWKNLASNNGFAAQFDSLVKQIHSTMYAVKELRMIFQADDMFEYVDYIREHPKGK